jgi:hypothetical protein
VAPLRTARALVLDADGGVSVDGHRMTLDSDLGLLLDPQGDHE